MPLPASFKTDGFLDPETARRGGRKFKRLMIGMDGPPDSGKTEFMLSAPGPGIVCCLDRGFDAVFDNPNPPKTRRGDFAFKVVQAPLATAATQEMFVAYWKEFYEIYRKGLANADCRTFGLDGDTDSWELQRLAEFGRLSKVPQNLYDNVNAARRAMYARAFDSGKIVIATNRTRKSYSPAKNPDGTPKLNPNTGAEVREWDGGYERQGFGDQDFLWNIQLRMMKNEEKGVWGLKIMKCKADPSLVGIPLWGDDCNFQSLVQVVYPHIPLSEWGY